MRNLPKFIPTASGKFLATALIVELHSAEADDGICLDGGEKWIVTMLDHSRHVIEGEVADQLIADDLYVEDDRESENVSRLG